MRAFEMDHVIAGLETLAELAGEKRPLLREIGRRDRQIRVGRDRPEKRKADAHAQRADAIVQLGNQKAGLPLFGGVGPGQERKIGDRHSQQLESRVFVIDDLLDLVANDPLGVELPHARLGRIVLAGFAGGVGALVEHHGLAAGLLAARRAEMGVVGRVGLQALDKSVLEIVSEIKHLGVDHRSIRFDQRRVPLRENTRGLAIVDHMVRAQEPAIVINPHVAIGGDRVFVLVVDEFPGLDHHSRRRRIVLARRGPCRRRAASSANNPSPRTPNPTMDRAKRACLGRAAWDGRPRLTRARAPSRWRARRASGEDRALRHRCGGGPSICLERSRLERSRLEAVGVDIASSRAAIRWASHSRGAPIRGRGAARPGGSTRGIPYPARPSPNRVAYVLTLPVSDQWKLMKIDCP